MTFSATTTDVAGGTTQSTTASARFTTMACVR
jgi:hypothetical protein